MPSPLPIPQCPTHVSHSRYQLTLPATPDTSPRRNTKSQPHEYTKALPGRGWPLGEPRHRWARAPIPGRHTSPRGPHLPRDSLTDSQGHSENCLSPSSPPTKTQSASKAPTPLETDSGESGLGEAGLRVESGPGWGQGVPRTSPGWLSASPSRAVLGKTSPRPG